jgi:Fur family ferric uptake transcriptional regulator
MSAHTLVLERLKRDGLRLTPQRILVLSAIAEGNGHMGVEEVYLRAKESYPYLDVATVYRTLHLFKKLGVVTEVAIGGQLRFELTDVDRKHHHMVCKSCGGAFDLSPAYLGELGQALKHQFGFEPDLDNFTVSGHCALCSEQRRREKE